LTLAPIVVAMIAGFLPLFIAWKVEGGNGARVGGVFSGDLFLVFFAFVGFAGLTYRFDQREKAAM
jgi:hypothetical protein